VIETVPEPRTALGTRTISHSGRLFVSSRGGTPGAVAGEKLPNRYPRGGEKRKR